MLIEHQGRRPQLAPTAYVAPNAVVCGDVVVGEDCRILFGAVVPIGWVAVGNPAQILPPDQHEAIWQVQRELDLVGTVDGIESASPVEQLAQITRGYAALFGHHRQDRILG
jgi:gamma-carbonic anhydrase